MKNAQKEEEVEDLRKQPRVHTPLPEETMKRLEELADIDARPVSNMASILIQAAIELINERDFKLVGGKLRKVTFESLEALEAED